MFLVKTIWRGGPTWNPETPSSIDVSKKKTPIEHLIETGGQTLEETIEALGHFKKMPIKVAQEKVPEDPSINWVTKFTIEVTNEEDSLFIANELAEFYEKKKQSLIAENNDYSVEIEISKI
jgi:hypothetical protein